MRGTDVLTGGRDYKRPAAPTAVISAGLVRLGRRVNTSAGTLVTQVRIGHDTIENGDDFVRTLRTHPFVRDRQRPTIFGPDTCHRQSISRPLLRAPRGSGNRGRPDSDGAGRHTRNRPPVQIHDGPALPSGDDSRGTFGHRVTIHGAVRDEGIFDRQASLSSSRTRRPSGVSW